MRKPSRNIVKNQTKISISIDGAEKTNDAIRGKGAYKAAVSAIERFSKEKLLNCLVYTFANAGEVTNANEADMRHVLDLAKKYDARWVVFHGMIPYSSDTSLPQSRLNPRPIRVGMQQTLRPHPRVQRQTSHQRLHTLLCPSRQTTRHARLRQLVQQLLFGQMLFWQIHEHSRKRRRHPLQLQRHLPSRQHQKQTHKTDLGGHAEQRVLQQSQRQSQHQGQMRRLRIQRSLRRMPNLQRCSIQETFWVRPKMLLHILKMLQETKISYQL